MAKVWEFSKNRGNDLLMLLAIADFADDDGNAYPSVPTLAEKCRMKPRNANTILAALRASGELEVRLNEGPRGTNRYRIVLPAEPLQERAGVQNLASLQERAAPPARTCSKPLHVSADEPSVNHQEPSTRARKQRRACSPSASDVDDGFADFWQQYPRKVAKAQAMQAWTKLKPDGQTLANLMAALESQKATEQWQKDGGKFIPHPSSWLNGRRWEDESLPPVPALPATAAPARAPAPGDIRTAHGRQEVFDDVMGWVPA